jgi:hypothetical protein
MVRCPKEVAVEPVKAQGKKEEIRTETGSSLQKQENRTVWFGKLKYPFF